jgi:hypothetical protein|tara:strand:- start:12396 stop:14117 length:1722 start_codon:yes stop_codon:yes gene_type:complete
MSENKSVENALKVVNDGFDVRNKQNGRIKSIQKLFQESFIISDPKGTKKLNAQRLYQVLWRTAGRTKPLDFTLNGVNKDGIPVDPNQERLVTAGVSTVMDKGGYNSAFRDKQGLAFNFLLYGDAFLQIGANDDKKSKIPIAFRVLSNDNIYVDNFATAVRAKASGASASKMVVVFTYSKDNFDEMWPDNNEVMGVIPRNRDEKEQIKDIDQELKDEDKVEVAHSYDLTTKTHVIFAGTQSKVLQEDEGDDYPFVMEGEEYIPIVQFMCMPSSEGFYNEGIGAMVYKLAMISRELLNMEVNHLQDNVYPITHVNIPKGEAAKYFNKLKAAHQMRSVGKKGYVAMEYDPNSPNSERVTSESLLTNNLFNEWQNVFDRLDGELRRLGINIDELDVAGDKTATEILALEENANAFVKQIMEYNATESKFAAKATLDMITEFVGKKDKTPLNLAVKIPLASGAEAQVGQITLGMISEELKVNHYWVNINSRSGAIPSNNVLRAEINSVLPFMQPGSPAWKRAVGQLSQLSNFDAQADEFLLEQQVETPTGTPEEAQAPASQTDRLTINARAKEQTPVL